jgi:hypothetical protein
MNYLRQDVHNAKQQGDNAGASLKRACIAPGLQTNLSFDYKRRSSSKCKLHIARYYLAKHVCPNVEGGTAVGEIVKRTSSL